jgi:hypothetical protein
MQLECKGHDPKGPHYKNLKGLDEIGKLSFGFEKPVLHYEILRGIYSEQS